MYIALKYVRNTTLNLEKASLINASHLMLLCLIYSQISKMLRRNVVDDVRKASRYILAANGPVATRWLQTICVINFFTCKRKVSNFVY